MGITVVVLTAPTGTGREIGIRVRLATSTHPRFPDTYTQVRCISPFPFSPPAADEARGYVAPTWLPSAVRSVHLIDRGRAIVITFMGEGIRCYDLDTFPERERWHLNPETPVL